MRELWNYDKNPDIDPLMYTAGAEVTVWWKCNQCNFEWETYIYRIKRSLEQNRNQSPCPACSGHTVWKGHNDLNTLFPDVAKEWDFEKNNGLLPDEFTSGSTRTVFWKCSSCGYEWHTSPYNRTKNKSGCPLCARKILSIKNGNPVRCVETGTIYHSAVEAGKAVGRSGSAILACLKGKCQTCGGFHWEFASASITSTTD